MSKDTRLADAILKPIIKRQLRNICDAAEYEFNKDGHYGHSFDMIANIPVEAKVYPTHPGGNIYAETDVEILTGYGTGIRHTMNPVTDEALSKVADDILKVEPWGNPWYSKPVEKEEPIHTVEYFDLNTTKNALQKF